MFSKSVMDALEKSGAIEKKKSKLETDQESINLKMEQVLAHNKYIEDAIARLKEQVSKGKQYKFVLTRDNDGLIKEVTAVPTGEFK